MVQSRYGTSPKRRLINDDNVSQWTEQVVLTRKEPVFDDVTSQRTEKVHTIVIKDRVLESKPGKSAIKIKFAFYS